MLDQRDASILIPGYGPAHLTDACLVTVYATSRPHEVLIWDNGIDHQDITNGEAVEVTRLLDQIYARSETAHHLTEPQSVWNVGFAGACNRMAAEATGEILVFLNCDTEPQEDWLEGLVRAFDEPDVGVAGARLVNPDGELQHAGIKVIIGGGIAWTVDIMDDLPTRDVAAVSGACLAIRRSVFEEIGGFDAEFWNCFEDGDLCLRVIQAGHRIRYVRESLVMHHGKATGAERLTRVFPQVVRFQEKWANSVLVQPEA